jgi:hypothetical protein
MGGRTLFLDLRYEPLRVPERPFLTETPLRVLLFPLEYKGQKGDELGSWLGFRGKEDIIKSTLPVGEAVTAVIFEYLKRAGFDVSMAPLGLPPERFDTGAHKGPVPDFLLHGSIDKFTVEAKSFFGYTEIKSELWLKLLITNVKDSSILTFNITSSSGPKTVVSLDQEIFGSTVNETLSEAIESIFTKTVVKEGVLRQATEF